MQKAPRALASGAFFILLSGDGLRRPASIHHRANHHAALKQRLHAFDLAFIESHPDQPAQQVYVKDPAGNQLEFLEIAH